MGKISGLPDELLVKIISFLPTKEAVSTCVLSKKWEFLWMWLPKLEFDDYQGYVKINRPNLCREFIAKNLQLYRAPILESLCLTFRDPRPLQPIDFNSWVEKAVSRCVGELSITYYPEYNKPDLLLPTILYTCKSLVTLKLEGFKILVDVPRMVCLLPSLKTLQLKLVRYLNEDSLRLLLNCCPILENLLIERSNLNALVVRVPSLQRLSLTTFNRHPSEAFVNVNHVIVTPSLKYFKVEDHRYRCSYSIDHMPELEDTNINVVRISKELLQSVTFSRRLSLNVAFNSAEETVYPDGIVFSRLEKLELLICSDNWSTLLVQLLKDSPKLKILNLYVDSESRFRDYKPVSWNNNQSSVPKCLLESLETFKFAGYKGRPEERAFLSFILKHARCLKSNRCVDDVMFTSET